MFFTCHIRFILSQTLLSLITYLKNTSHVRLYSFITSKDDIATVGASEDLSPLLMRLPRMVLAPPEIHGGSGRAHGGVLEGTMTGATCGRRLARWQARQCSEEVDVDGS